MTYFTQQFSTLDELKAAWRALCKKLHPDAGGNAAEFQAMQNEFERILNDWQYYERRADKETESEAADIAAHLRAIIDKVIRLHGNFKIEIIGRWIWLTGETYRLVAELKALGFFWSKSKKAWFWNGEEHKRARGHYSLQHLRERWGSDTVDYDSPANIQAGA